MSEAPDYAQLRPFTAQDAPTGAETVVLHESRAGGWWGRATTKAQGLGGEASEDTPIARTARLCAFLESALVPGAAVGVELQRGPGRASAPAARVRTWPSIVTAVRASSDDAAYHVHFADPITARARTPIWGAWAGCSPGQILGGALSLAAGGNGRPTLAPQAAPPPVRIAERLRTAVAAVPYAVATGDRLVPWLGELFGRLGVRMQLLGHPNGRIGVTLLDTPPSGTTVALTLGAGPPSETNADLIATRLRSPDSPQRATLLDDPTSDVAVRIGPPGAVERVLTSAQSTVEEATLRAGFDAERDTLRLMRLRVHTRNAELSPGTLVRFTNDTEDQPDVRQAGNVTHHFASHRHAGARDVRDARGVYANEVVLEAGGIAWRPAVEPPRAPRTVAGVVEDGTTTRGEAIERDREGRIPVRLCFVPGNGTAGEKNEESAHAASAPGWPPRIALPVITAIGAGDSHGFIGAHRSGDACRVRVHHPMYAEIAGFEYRDDRRIGSDMTGASAAFVAREDPSGEWTGIAFRSDGGGTAR